jgi:hypothetical protein
MEEMMGMFSKIGEGKRVTIIIPLQQFFYHPERMQHYLAQYPMERDLVFAHNKEDPTATAIRWINRPHVAERVMAAFELTGVEYTWEISSKRDKIG